MGTTPPMTRRAKAARRKIKAVSKTSSTRPAATPANKRKQQSVEDIELLKQSARQARCDETKKRNAAVQQLPQAKRQRKRNIRVGSTDSHKLEQDKIGKIIRKQ